MSASVVEELRAGFEEPFWALGRDSERDRRTVVASWPTVPIELVRAAGFVPVFARGHRGATPAADRVLEPQVFPNRLRQLVEAALTGRLANVAAVLLPRSADPDYKCFLYLRELARKGIASALPPILLFDLLHSDDDLSRVYNADRARVLGAQLARLAGRQVAPEDLRRAIVNANRARAAARRLDHLRTGTPRVSGSEALPLLGAFWQVEPERYAVLANAAQQAAARQSPLDGPRVVAVGVPVDGIALHTTLEVEGAVVVAETSPFGRCGTSADVAVSDEPFAALANHCANESVDARLPVERLMRKIEAVAGMAEAVVFSLPPDDASFGWDYPRVRALLERHTIPHAVVRGDPAMDAAAGDREVIRTLLASARDRREARRG